MDWISRPSGVVGCTVDMGVSPSTQEHPKHMEASATPSKIEAVRAEARRCMPSVLSLGLVPVGRNPGRGLTQGIRLVDHFRCANSGAAIRLTKTFPSPAHGC